MSGSFFQILVIQAAMSAGLFPVVVTKFYGGSEDVAVRGAAGTVALSVLTTPLWLNLGLGFLGG